MRRLQADRRDQHEAEPRPSRSRPGGADPALPRPQRDRHAGDRPPERDRRGQHVDGACVVRAGRAAERRSASPKSPIVCGMARATLPDSEIDWDGFEGDYDLIRDKIEAVFPELSPTSTRASASRRLPPATTARESGSGTRRPARRTSSSSPAWRRIPRSRARDAADADDDPQPRPVQHDDLRPRRPLSRRVRRQDGRVHERGRTWPVARHRPRRSGWSSWNPWQQRCPPDRKRDLRLTAVSRIPGAPSRPTIPRANGLIPLAYHDVRVGPPAASRSRSASAPPRKRRRMNGSRHLGPVPPLARGRGACGSAGPLPEETPVALVYDGIHPRGDDGDAPGSRRFRPRLQPHRGHPVPTRRNAELRAVRHVAGDRDGADEHQPTLRRAQRAAPYSHRPDGLRPLRIRQSEPVASPSRGPQRIERQPAGPHRGHGGSTEAAVEQSRRRAVHGAAWAPDRDAPRSARTWDGTMRSTSCWARWRGQVSNPRAASPSSPAVAAMKWSRRRWPGESACWSRSRRRRRWPCGLPRRPGSPSSPGPMAKATVSIPIPIASQPVKRPEGGPLGPAGRPSSPRMDSRPAQV